MLPDAIPKYPSFNAGVRRLYCIRSGGSRGVFSRVAERISEPGPEPEQAAEVLNPISRLQPGFGSITRATFQSLES